MENVILLPSNPSLGQVDQGGLGRGFRSWPKNRSIWASEAAVVGFPGPHGSSSSSAPQKNPRILPFSSFHVLSSLRSPLPASGNKELVV